MSSELLKKLCCCTPGCFQKVELCDCDEGPGEDLWTVCGSAEDPVIILRNGKCYTYDPNSDTYESISKEGTLIDIEPSEYESCEECCNPPGDYDKYEICSPFSSTECTSVFYTPHVPGNPDYITRVACCYQKTGIAVDRPPGSSLFLDLTGFDHIESCDCAECFNCPPNCEECSETYVFTIPAFRMWGGGCCQTNDCDENNYPYLNVTELNITIIKVDGDTSCRWFGSEVYYLDLMYQNQVVETVPTEVEAQVQCDGGRWIAQFWIDGVGFCFSYEKEIENDDCCPPGTYEWNGSATCIQGCDMPDNVTVS